MTENGRKVRMEIGNKYFGESFSHSDNLLKSIAHLLACAISNFGWSLIEFRTSDI